MDRAAQGHLPIQLYLMEERAPEAHCHLVTTLVTKVRRRDPALRWFIMNFRVSIPSYCSFPY